MFIGLILVLLALAIGLAQGIIKYLTEPRNQHDTSGWLYFIGGKGTLIKIGMSSHDPSERLKDIQATSPFPLRTIYKLKVADRYKTERMVHEHLASFRKHGEWFDRDATLAFIEHIKGSY